MGGSAMDAVQAAIYDVLTADADLTAPVYDDVPQGAAFPYVRIGETTESPSNVFGGVGRSVTVTLHVWSEYQGWMEANGIADTIDLILDDAGLVVTGWDARSCQLETRQSLIDPDGLARHIVCRYRVEVER